VVWGSVDVLQARGPRVGCGLVLRYGDPSCFRW